MVKSSIENRTSMQWSAWMLSGMIFLQQIMPAWAAPYRINRDHSFYSAPVTPVFMPVRQFQPILKAETKAPQLPGGPEQPEVQSFAPIELSNMVDPFTGDFSYNLPLMDVDGYPINLAYSAGTTMDAEASWVGLGWNLNPGVVNRMMRGLPDEFNGDKIVKEYNVRNDFTFGVSGSLDFELVGLQAKLNDIPVNLDDDPNNDDNYSANIGLKLGISYNSYNGFSSDFSVSPSFGVAKANKPSYNFSLGLSGSSSAGPSISPNFSVTKESYDTEGVLESKSTRSFGASLSSRSGLRNVSFETSKYSRKQQDGKTKEKSFSGSSSYDFGHAVFSPPIQASMNSAGGTLRFKWGVDVFGGDGSAMISAFYNNRWVKDKRIEVPAYGYFNLQNGQLNEDAKLDFTRENDGPFTRHTPALAVTGLTPDFFSVSGQGVSGSYRQMRNDIGYVFDPVVRTDAVDGSIGGEVNAGSVVKAGIDIEVTYSNSKSKVWTLNNQAAKHMRFKPQGRVFREANELSNTFDSELFNIIGGYQPIALNNGTFLSLDNSFLDPAHSSFWSSLKRTGDVDVFTRSNKEKRNQLFTYITREEQAAGMGIEAPHPNLYNGQYTTNVNQSLGGHPGEVTVTSQEGARYVYGIAAYNIFQKEVTFSTENEPTGDNCKYQLVGYTAQEASVGNESGRQRLYSANTTPAYAHSFLLTSVLNSDYSDVDHVKGPSKGDLGGYVKFAYKKIADYQWRTPAAKSTFIADYDAGLYSDTRDDKGHYTFGNKELWYVDRIETKNHVLLFYTSDRADGHGVTNEHGVISASAPSMQKLDSIVLYTLHDFEQNGLNAIPIKKAHFRYDYSLCKNYSGNINSSGQTGKLTLKKVFFTYQNSQKGRYNPYEFNYSSFNPDYDLKSVDRWGTFKGYTYECDHIQHAPLRPSDYPYVGFDKASVDQYASAWNLTEIRLPSGGKIEIDYESDDYAYVQHKKAGQMFKIIGVNNDTGDVFQDSPSISNNGLKNAGLYFEIMPGYENASDYGKAGERIYFRALMNFKTAGAGHDYVPGYAEIENISIMDVGGQKMGYLKLKPAKLNDAFAADYNPIAVAAIQWGRMQISNMLPPSNQQDEDENKPWKDLGESLLGAFASYKELFTGPNRALWGAPHHIGTELAVGYSWVRLNNPNKAKLGGGHRVKEVRIYDAWDAMTNNVMEGFHYGQKYTYTLEDGTSSGVAAYEPQAGGDENIWHQPVDNTDELFLAPDMKNYQETPFGENFFPTATVGYSRVTVANLPRPGVKKTATGKVVNEFYTAKDFPTFVSRTVMNPHRLFIPLRAYFFSLSIDWMSGSQGFAIQKNDMHGKPKATYVYAEDQTSPISSVEYYYKSADAVVDLVPVKQLVNECKSIDRKGNVANITVGLDYDAVGDFRQSTSNMVSGSINLNFNAVLLAPLVIPIPMITGSGALERTAFRSATFTKVIERFGILERTVAKDLTSVVETKNLAYDAETGDVLLTETITNFNDKIYSFKYPAHWYYESMAASYLNTDQVNVSVVGINFNDGYTTQMNGLNSTYFPGDELMIKRMDMTWQKAWVSEVNPNNIRIIDKYGQPLNLTARFIRVYRSGHKNLQMTEMANMISLTNPLDNFKGNLFGKVLQASSVEFSEEWRTFCECYDDPLLDYTNNPWVINRKGIWRPTTTYTHLTGRSQTMQNNNTNIRIDGVFTSYTPFYRLKNGKWGIDRQNWTSPTTITEFSPEGQALETIDALQRNSASSFGYNQTLNTGVAVNSAYRQFGFDGFEDYDFSACTDKHFHLTDQANITMLVSHTGKHSLKVSQGNPVTYGAELVEDCSEDACEMEGVSTVTASGLDYQIINGTAPYTFETETIFGQPGIQMFATEDGLHIQANGAGWKLKVTVTDSKGCTFVTELK